MRSLTARLTGSLAIAVLLLGALVLGGLHYSLNHLAVTFLSARLDHDLDSLVTGIRFDNGVRLTLDDSRLAPFFRQPYSGHYFIVRVGDQIVRSRSLWDAELALPPAAERPRGRAFFLTGPNGQRLLALERQVRRQGQPVTLVVTEDFDPIDQALNRLRLRLGAAALAVLAVLLLAQHLIVRAGLRPLGAVRQQILRLTSGEIQQLDAPAPREIQPLVVELNRLLTVLARRLERSRHALGNLAHALKTPLAVLTQAADQLRNNSGAAIRQQADQIGVLIERELRRARIVGAATPGQRVRFAAVVADLVATLQKIYREKSLDISVEVAPELMFPGDRNDLMELLGNLLDNACRWATGRVRVRAEARPGAVAVTVDDDGPGCPPERLAALTNRGTRLDESSSGYGLGLAIVFEIVDQYQGQLTLDRSPELGGFQAAVWLPGHGVSGKAGHKLA